MKLNVCNLLLVHMVYLLPKHNHFTVSATFTQYHDTYTQIDDTKPWLNPL
jgi:hypothetical protein